MLLLVIRPIERERQDEIVPILVQVKPLEVVEDEALADLPFIVEVNQLVTGQPDPRRLEIVGRRHRLGAGEIDLLGRHWPRKHRQQRSDQHRQQDPGRTATRANHAGGLLVRRRGGTPYSPSTSSSVASARAPAMTTSPARVAARASGVGAGTSTRGTMRSTRSALPATPSRCMSRLKLASRSVAMRSRVSTGRSHNCRLNGPKARLRAP